MVIYCLRMPRSPLLNSRFFSVILAKRTAKLAFKSKTEKYILWTIINLMSTEIQHIEPKIGEGIYLVRDVSKILKINYAKTNRWIVDYWGRTLDKNIKYIFGDADNRAINFLSLIEFYTFFRLREKGLSTSQIRELHHHLSKVLSTKYPFATAQDFYVEKGKKAKKFVYYEYLDNLIRHDKKNQFSLRFVQEFLEKIEFDDNNLASRFFPLAKSRNIVVDPKHQFGQPVIAGTNIKTQTIFSLYEGGESLEDIGDLYNISIDKVQDAIAFQKAA